MYTVHFVGPDHPKLDGARGHMYGEPPEVYIDATRSAREVLELVWHELTHAVNEEHSLLIPRKRLTEERVATCHGHAWTQVLLDNPKLRAWIDLASDYIKSELETEPE